MQSSAIVLHVNKKKSMRLVMFDTLYGKIDVIDKNSTSVLFNGALIACSLYEHKAKRYLLESSLDVRSLPSNYTDLIFMHSLLEFTKYTHLYENACSLSFEVLEASLLSMDIKLKVPHKIAIMAKLFLLGGIINDENTIATNVTDYLIYTPAKDILKEVANDLDCAALTQWIWSCLATHPHKDELHVVYQQLHLFKEYFL